MSPVSNDLKTEAWAPASDLPLVLLTIEHDDLASPILVVNNTEDVVSNGDTYTAFPFDIVLPDSVEDAPPRAKLKIDNVSREIVQAVRSISTAADVTISVVRQSAPDVIEVTFPGMRLHNVQADALVVQGDLIFEDLTHEPFPAVTYSPASFPGLL